MWKNPVTNQLIFWESESHFFAVRFSFQSQWFKSIIKASPHRNNILSTVLLHTLNKQKINWAHKERRINECSALCRAFIFYQFEWDDVSCGQTQTARDRESDSDEWDDVHYEISIIENVDVLMSDILTFDLDRYMNRNWKENSVCAEI